MGWLSADEPFSNLLTQGMVLKDGAKMSKSKGNVVDPDQMITAYGADTVRLFILFAAPPERDLEWSDKGMEGAHRFIKKIWRLVADNLGHLSASGTDRTALVQAAKTSDELKKIRQKTHKTIQKVTEDIEKRFHFNTAISAVMELVNQVKDYLNTAQAGNRPAQTCKPEPWPVLREALETALILLAPMVPHVTDELWQMLGHTESITTVQWPGADPGALESETVNIVVQVNGKVRGRIQVPQDSARETIETEALKDSRVSRFTQGTTVKKIIHVPGRLINIVVTG
ncbi:MAG TPA: hypothetical protein EYP57_10345 [Thermodesulfobacteriaceae bacterium]|nr:hypothetical protein [Thermodesulfobacteriaceae bacterium]